MTKHTKTDTTTEDHASTDEQPESIQLVADGVVIEKTAGAAADVDDVLTVSFDIKSERDETFELRLVEDLPAVAHGHDIGFHPEFDPDNWTITDGDRLVYEAVLHPREQRTTVYGIDGLAEAAGEIVSVRPAIETRASPEDAPIDTAPREVDPGEDPTGGIAPDEDPTGASPDEELAGDGSGVSDEATTGGFEYGEDEGPPGAPGDPMAEEGTLAGVDGNEEAPPTESRDSHDSRTSSTLPNDGSVLDALMVELTAAELSEANRELLREKLGLAPRNSLETKVRNLQNTVDDLIVYRDALEEFIDDVLADCFPGTVVIPDIHLDGVGFLILEYVRVFLEEPADDQLRGVIVVKIVDRRGGLRGARVQVELPDAVAPVLRADTLWKL